MAERMGKLRQKERDKREAFRKQVQAYIPLPVLAGLGLTQQPPHCQISLPPPAPGLPSITLADLQKAPLSADPTVRLPARIHPPPYGPLGKTAATPHRGQPTPCSSLAALPSLIKLSDRVCQASASTLLPFGAPSPPSSPTSPAAAAEDSAAEALASGMTGAQALEMENARLRAELAVRYAEECLRAMSFDGNSSNPPASPARAGRISSSQGASSDTPGNSRPLSLQLPDLPSCVALLHPGQRHPHSDGCRGGG